MESFGTITIEFSPETVKAVDDVLRANLELVQRENRDLRAKGELSLKENTRLRDDLADAGGEIETLKRESFNLRAQIEREQLEQKRLHMRIESLALALDHAKRHTVEVYLEPQGTGHQTFRRVQASIYADYDAAKHARGDVLGMIVAQLSNELDRLMEREST